MRDRLERLFTWLVGLVLIGIAAYVLYRVYARYSPLIDHLDPRLPMAFHAGENLAVFWGWVLVLAAVGFAGFHRARRRYRVAALDLPADVPDAPDDGLGPGILPAGARPTDPVYLLLGPSSEAISDLLYAASLEPRGGSALATQPTRAALVNVAKLVEQGESLDGLCRVLTEADSGVPALRGLFVVLPLEWLGEPEPSRRARAFGSQARSVRDRLRLEAPVYVVVTGLERLPGFPELAGCLGGPQGRWGISPAGPGGRELATSLAKFWEILRRKTLDAMARGFADRALNGRLFATVERLAALERPLLEAIDGAFPPDDESPTRLRGVDLTATGKFAAEQAGALFAIFGRIAMEPAPTSWSDEALASDRRSRRRAWIVATLGALATVAAWLEILLVLGSLGTSGYVVAATLALAWIVALVAMKRRRPAPARGESGKA